MLLNIHITYVITYTIIDIITLTHLLLGASQKGTASSATKRRHVSPERSSSYRKRTRSRERSPYEYEPGSRRRRDRERSSPYSSSLRKRHERRRRSK